MPTRVDIPNVGIVEFPDGMDDAQITDAITTSILPQHAVAGDAVDDTPTTSVVEPESNNNSSTAGAGAGFFAEFSDHLKTPIQAMKEDSIVSNLYDYATGNTDLDRVKAAQKIVNKPDAVGTPEYDQAVGTIREFGHLLDDPGESQGALDMVSELVKTGKAHPGMVTAEFTNAIMADPWMLVPWFWNALPARVGTLVTKSLANVASATTKAAVTTTAKLGASGVVGGTFGGTIGASARLGSVGEFDFKDITPDILVGAVANMSLTGVADLIAKRAANKTGVSEAVIIEALKQNARKPNAKPVAEVIADLAKAHNATPDSVLASLNSDISTIVKEGFVKSVKKQKVQASKRKPKHPKTGTYASGWEDVFGAKASKVAAATTKGAAAKAAKRKLQKAEEDLGIDAKLNKVSDDFDAAYAAEGVVPPMGKAKNIAAIAAGAAVAGGASLYADPEDIAAATTLALAGGVGVKLLQRMARTTIDHARDPINLRAEKQGIALTEEWASELAGRTLSTERFVLGIKQVLPDPKDRELVSHLLEHPERLKDPAISEHVRNVTKEVRKYFDDISTVAKDRGVIKTHIKDFLPHFWKEKLEAGQRPIHSRARTIKDVLVEGRERGLTPVTMDIARIAGAYGQTLHKSIMNAELKNALLKAELKGLTFENGKPFKTTLLRTGGIGKVPQRFRDRYVKPGLTGLDDVLVDKEIVDSLRFVWNAKDPSTIRRGVEAMNFALKRGAVAASFFHASALLESMLFAGAVRDIPSVVFGKGGQGLAQLRAGGMGDVVDTALRGGLKVGAPEDLGMDVFYGTLNTIQQATNKHLITKPIAGVVKGYEKINQAFDHVMWDKILNGGKLSVFMKEYEKALIKHPNMPVEQVAKEVSEFVNDAFGGLNWQHIAQNTSNRLLRKIASESFNPSKRKIMQLLLFAPDWTIANIRVIGKSIPMFNKSKVSRRLYQNYAARAALAYATLGNAINQMYTGHSIFENEDPTRIDLGDGRNMVWSKQLFEPYHWVTEPTNTLTNKVGSLLKLGGEQLLNKKFLNANGAPPLFDADEDSLPTQAKKRITHFTSKFLPIYLQSILKDSGVDIDEILSSFLGHPIRPVPQG